MATDKIKTNNKTRARKRHYKDLLPTDENDIITNPRPLKRQRLSKHYKLNNKDESKQESNEESISKPNETSDEEKEIILEKENILPNEIPMAKQPPKNITKKLINTNTNQNTMEIEMQTEQYLDQLFTIGTVKREKAINLFTKILSKIISFPNEEKYQSLNYTKVSSKFTQFQCLFMVELLLFSGFVIENNRLKLKENKTEIIMNKLNEKIKFEQNKLENERLKIIQQNEKRMQTKSNLKQKKLRNKILMQHKQQMKLATQGVYNVKATVSDRKGTGNGVNTL